MKRKQFNIFGTSYLPQVDFGLHDMGLKAQGLTDKLSLSGVQPKLSVKLDKKQNLLVPAAEGGEFILKPQINEYPYVPENEQCCMDLAESLGMNVPAHCLIPLKDGTLAYVIRRFDREKGQKLHQEDFAQVLGLTDKYKGSVEQIARKIKEVSTKSGYDLQIFFERVVLNFIVGNGDAHLKNYSLCYRDGNQCFLSPIYDVVCSKLIIPEEEDSALTINGKKNKLKREDFDQWAECLKIPEKIRYERFEHKFEFMSKIVKESALQHDMQDAFIGIIQNRLVRLNLI